jgi:flagellar basal-body rod protein FlgB
MVDGIIGSSTINILERTLDASSLRHKVISNNIANVDTPGFKRSNVLFEEKLKLALEGTGQGKIAGYITNTKHIPIGYTMETLVNPEVKLQNDTSLRNDGNNVDIDVEMAHLAENTLWYQALTQQISGKFSSLKSVINGGR